MSAHEHAGEGIRAAVALLSVSDSRTRETDGSGQAARRLLEAQGHGIVDYEILPDEPEAVRERVLDWLGRDDVDAILVNGGTGISQRDRTFEALSGLIDKRLDGFGELFRMLSFEQVGSRAMVSRACAGIARGKPLFSLPGSTKAVTLALERLIVPELRHLLAELRKD